MRVYCFLIFVPCALAAEVLHADYSVDWKVEGKHVRFQIEARTKGWIGLGFNSKEKMRGADIVVAGLKDGHEYHYDLHGITENTPPPDSQSDYEVQHASQNDTHTILSIRRLLDTGDEKDDYKLTVGSPFVLLWAYGDEPAKNTYEFNYHGSSHRGTREITLT